MRYVGIVGFPKSGTTALSAALARLPQFTYYKGLKEPRAVFFDHISDKSYKYQRLRDRSEPCYQSFLRGIEALPSNYTLVDGSCGGAFYPEAYRRFYDDTKHIFSSYWFVFVIRSERERLESLRKHCYREFIIRDDKEFFNLMTEEYAIKGDPFFWGADEKEGTLRRFSSYFASEDNVHIISIPYSDLGSNNELSSALGVRIELNQRNTGVSIKSPKLYRLMMYIKPFASHAFVRLLIPNRLKKMLLKYAKKNIFKG